MPINPLGNTYSEDITEDLLYDITRSQEDTQFTPSDIAYDLSINSIPFVIKSDNQYKYVRETAQYKKDQFDNSPEPGEQSLTGWWLRSQTSWHNGAGIEFYEPGSDYEHVSHRFHDSRGINVWTVGEATLHKEVFHSYTGAQGINAATGNDGSKDVLVSGDANGILKKISLGVTGPNGPMDTANYVHTGTTFPEGHNGSNFPFTSVTTSGGKYYATCTGAIHRGTVGTLDSDVVFARHSASSNAFVKYAKGFIFFGENHVLNLLDDSQGNTSAHSGALPAGKQYDSRTHLDSTFVWNDIAGGQTHIYASGNSGNSGEIWKMPFDDAPTSTNNGTLLPNLSGATVNITLPDSELVKAIHFYLGYLVVGTNRGVRICPVNANGDLVLGPLLIESSYPVNGFTERGTYIYAATKVNEGPVTHGILIRIDLSQQFNDGTFAYAYDLEYQSTPDASDCTEVYNLDNRLVMVIEEGGAAGELQVEHTTDYRESGWLQTGKIRYGTTEPKFFKFINVNGLVDSGDGIGVSTIDFAGNEIDLITLDTISVGSELEIAQPALAVEQLAFKFTLVNGSPNSSVPKLQSYQIKSLPASRRQRIIQYHLQCFDSEFDRFNTQFGYTDRGFQLMQMVEELEERADFVRIQDYRTNEVFTGLIEEVRFSNESSPDKDNNGFGGILTITVRKV